jgi:hypothetical protein
VLPCPANGGKPPVRSCLLKKRGAARGIRLIDLASLEAHLNGLADAQGHDVGQEPGNENNPAG